MIVDYNEWEGVPYQAVWHPAPFKPPREHTTQASGICFTDQGQVMLVGNDHRWTIPGGHPDSYETVEEALTREVWEEATARVTSCHYLGCQRVEPVELDNWGEGLHYQTRFWARVELVTFIPNEECSQRMLVASDLFLATLSWGHSQIIRAAFHGAFVYERSLGHKEMRRFVD